MNNKVHDYSNFSNMSFPLPWGFYPFPFPTFAQNFYVKKEQFQEHEQQKRNQYIKQQKIINDMSFNYKNQSLVKVEVNVSLLSAQTQQRKNQTNSEFCSTSKLLSTQIKVQEIYDKNQNEECENNVWTLEQEKKLLQYVQLFGKKWKYITTLFQGKTVGSVRSKYTKKLCPQSIDKWSENQNQLLVELIKLYGHSWKKISQKMPTKTPNQLKNQYYGFIRKSKIYEEFIKWESKIISKPIQQNQQQNTNSKQIKNQKIASQ